jgi:5-methylcytosine-specific restriction enzyme subunit McrC
MMTMTKRVLTMSKPQFERASPIAVDLREWSCADPSNTPALAGATLADLGRRQVVESLRSRIDVRQDFEGLAFESTSYVGRVDVGRFRISIAPKIDRTPLATLLRYAYGLSDLEVSSRTELPIAKDSFADLLITLFCEEVEILLYRGLARRYRAARDILASPRGRIDVGEIARRGGVLEARLPCRFFERSVDAPPNRVVRASLARAARLASDHALRQRAHRLEAMFTGVAALPSLRSQDVETAMSRLTRMEENYRPALALAALFVDDLGVTFDAAQPASAAPGFLFDMNRFFQRLLSRFLHEHLAQARIEDERAIRHLFAYLPENRAGAQKPPNPRPDYALFEGGELRAFIDAKYRDIGARGYPASWLYQLSIYALASPRRVSVLLYASTAEDTADQRVEIRQPLRTSSAPHASVIIRAVSLRALAALLALSPTAATLGARRRFASDLVSLQSESPARAAA